MEINVLIQLTLMKRWSSEQHPSNELITCPQKDYGGGEADQGKTMENHMLSHMI